MCVYCLCVGVGTDAIAHGVRVIKYNFTLYMHLIPAVVP